MRLYGFLFQWNGFSSERVGKAFEGDPFIYTLNEASKLTDITNKQGVKVPKPLPEKWRLIEFLSDEPLTKEDSDSAPRSLDRNSYPYWIYIRSNIETGAVIVASASFRITVQAVMTINTYILPKMQRRNIRVAELAERLLRQEARTEYFITLLTTDVPGYGDSVKSLSLEGDDIAGAGFFHFTSASNNVGDKQGLRYKNFTAKRIGLRPVDSRIECGRFGTENRIEFSDEGLQELEDFLGYVGV